MFIYSYIVPAHCCTGHPLAAALVKRERQAHIELSRFPSKASVNFMCWKQLNQWTKVSGKAEGVKDSNNNRLNKHIHSADQSFNAAAWRRRSIKTSHKEDLKQDCVVQLNINMRFSLLLIIKMGVTLIWDADGLSW